MGNDYNEYFRGLYHRLSAAFKVPFQEVTFPGWHPKLNDCHANAKFWAANNAATTVVTGWLFWPPDIIGRCTFRAHSVIEENGQLIDITPIDKNTPRDGLLFLRHVGKEDEFEQMKTVCAEVLYPPVTMDEWQGYQLSAGIGEETDA